MAKRKRLIPTPFETKTAGPLPAPSVAPAPVRAPAPVAQVAGAAAGASALQEMADYIASARAEGRLLVSLPLTQIETAHLQRDRLMPEDPCTDEDMQALIESLRERGQQTPIDVVRIIGDPRERYGLISGLRRVTALQLLWKETGEQRFASVKARIIQPENAPDAYRSMVEENEIRAGLSFYERARIAVKAAEVGAFTDPRAALRGLYGNVSRAKRSKIGSFMALVEALDGALRFPASLSEKRGLALAKVLADDDTLAGRLTAALEASAPENPMAEQGVIDSVLRPDVSRAKHQGVGKDAPMDREQGGDIDLSFETGRLVLSGPGVTEVFHGVLRQWLEDVKVSK